MASEVQNNPMMTIPVPQSGDAGRSSSAPKPQPKSDAPKKTSFADELAKGGQAEPAQPKPQPPRSNAPGEKVDRPAKDAAEKAGDKAEAQTAAQENAKKLSPLKKAAAGAKKEIDNAPVVAFLTGHLEKVQPTDIPDLVAGNAFVADALGESDISAFLNKPASIGDILDDLELPKGLADVAEQMGLDLDQVVTPSELLRAIGVDPSKVLLELKNLKTSLGAEGLAPYMRKAAMLAEQNAPTGQQNIEPYPGWAKNTTPPPVPATPVTGTFDPTKVTQQTPTVQPPAPQPKMASLNPNMLQQGQAQALTPEELARLAAEGPFTALGLTPTELFRALQPAVEMPKGKPEDALTTSLSPAAEALASVGTAEMPELPALDLGAMPQGGMNPGEASLEVPRAPAMHKATFDAFNLMTDKLKNVDTQSVDMTRTAEVSPSALTNRSLATQPAGRSLEEELTSVAVSLSPVRNEQPTLNVGGKPTSKAPGTELKPDTTQPLALGRAPEIEIAPSNVTERIAAEPTAFTQQVASGLPSKATLDVPRGMMPSQAIPADELRLAAPVLSDRGRGAGGQDMGQSGQGDRGKEESSTPFSGAERLFADALGGRTASISNQTHHAFSVAKAPEMGLSSEQRLDLFQQVMDRATTLAKDGGGVVRLDFGGQGLGQLEMAVKMQDDKMDLKILTGNERVKEAMMSELGRLRDALSVQNVQLGQVDVGVGGRQHQPNFNAFAGQGGFQQQQRQAFSGERHMPERRGDSGLNVERLAELRRPMPAFAASQIMNNNSVAGAGRLNVRV